jgi:hypothetical protein
MSKNKIVIPCILMTGLLLLVIGSAGAEVIKVSKMNRETSKFSIKRDIFSPIPMAPQQNRVPVVRQPLTKPDKKKVVPDLENEVRRSVFYEGYISKGEKSHALLNVSGEYFVVAEGDTVLQRIEVIKIEKKAIIIEVESRSIEITRKGENGEN